MDIHCAKRKRYARQQLEQQIESALCAMGKFEQPKFLLLLNRFREAAGFLDYSLSNGQTSAHSSETIIRAMTRIVRSRRYWVREPFDWQTTAVGTIRQHLGSLVHHLFATHPVPAFMTDVWWTDSPHAEQHCKWFRHLARGHSILGIKHPRIRSKIVANRFLQAPDHLTVQQAIDWAQKPAPEKNAPAIYPCGLSSRRRKRIFDPEIHDLWKRIGVSDFLFSEFRLGQTNTWRIRQIRCEAKLKEEGRAMEHCVGTYADCCQAGRTTIWSMTCKTQQIDVSPATTERALTIELLPTRTIQTALGHSNRAPTKIEREILEIWANREGLKIDRWV